MENIHSESAWKIIEWIGCGKNKDSKPSSAKTDLISKRIAYIYREKLSKGKNLEKMLIILNIELKYFSSFLKHKKYNFINLKIVKRFLNNNYHWLRIMK
jgi:hypothetical protein